MTCRFKSNVIKLFVIAVLLSSVACGELPELTQLMDNTSNDFTVPSFLIADFANVVAAQLSGTATAPASCVTPRQRFSDIQQHASIFCSSRSSLQLYSILRT